MRISDWSSDVCSSDLAAAAQPAQRVGRAARRTRDLDPALDRPPLFGGRKGADAGGRRDRLEPRSRQGRPRFGLWQRHGPSVPAAPGDPKGVVEGKRVSDRVDLAGGRLSKKKKTYKKYM